MRADNKHCMWGLGRLYEPIAIDYSEQHHGIKIFTHAVLHFLSTKWGRVSEFMKWDEFLSLR
jgi:hypothetical protein